MGFTLSGFSVRDNVKVQNAINSSNKAIRLAYVEMKGIRRSHNISPCYRRFFGVADANRIDKVWRVMSMMEYAAGASFIEYIRSIGRPGTYAAAQRPKSGWSEKDVKQILDRGEFRMKVDDEFYSPTTPVWEQTLTMAHELSHLVGNTDDEECPWDGEEAYGLKRVRRLAEQYPNLAVNNADSYGYYVMAVTDSLRIPTADNGPLDLTALFG